MKRTWIASGRVRRLDALFEKTCPLMCLTMSSNLSAFLSAWTRGAHHLRCHLERSRGQQILSLWHSALLKILVHLLLLVSPQRGLVLGQVVVGCSPAPANWAPGAQVDAVEASPPSTKFLLSIIAPFRLSGSATASPSRAHFLRLKAAPRGASARRAATAQTTPPPPLHQCSGLAFMAVARSPSSRSPRGRTDFGRPTRACPHGFHLQQSSSRSSSSRSIHCGCVLAPSHPPLRARATQRVTQRARPHYQRIRLPT